MKCPKCGKYNPDDAQECQWAFCRFDLTGTQSPSAQGEIAEFDIPKMTGAKLIGLSVTTFGVYQIVWMYRHWAALKRIEKLSIWPIPRAFFGPFYNFQLFRKYEKYLLEIGETFPASALTLALLFIVFNFCSRLPGPWGFLYFLSIVPVWLVQNSLNGISTAEEETLKGWSMVIVVIGGLILAVAIFGALVSETPSE